MRRSKWYHTTAKLLLPGKKIGTVGIAICVGVAAAILAKVALPFGKVVGVDVAIVVEVGAKRGAHF